MPLKPTNKKILIVVFILLTTGIFGYFFSEMYGFARGVKQDAFIHFKWLQNKTKIYFIDLPPGFDTMAFKATITLDPAARFHKIKLPNGGTETDVLIYDSTYLTTLQHSTLPGLNPLVYGSFSLKNDVLLDITTLTKGRYYVHYLACEVGGIFPLIIN